MKYSLFLLGVLVTTVMSAPAEAQNYPWCAYYGGGATGAPRIAGSRPSHNAWRRLLALAVSAG